jgi:hypothetical protein
MMRPRQRASLSLPNAVGPIVELSNRRANYSRAAGYEPIRPGALQPCLERQERLFRATPFPSHEFYRDVEPTAARSHFVSMTKNKAKAPPGDLIQTWTLPSAVTLGSSVRARGILLELRPRLPVALRKSLAVSGATLVLAMAKEAGEEFRSIVNVVTSSLVGIESLPVIPREIEDILAISTSERRRWLEDGRLTSAGTRTVRLRGRARQITFHVYDPKVVDDLLNGGAVDEWREEDAVAKAQNRRRAAYQAKLTRLLNKANKDKPKSERREERVSAQLAGWEEFDRDGILR